MAKVLHVLLLFVLSNSVLAGINGTIVGTVKDKDGKPLQGATVRVLGTTRGAIVKSNGTFTIANVPSGTYEVKATMIQFKENLKKGVVVSADREITVNFIMQQSTIIKDTVVVTADRNFAPDAKTEGIQRVASGKELVKSTRTEGAVSAALTQAGTVTSGGGIAIRGSRPTDTQYRVDGLDVSDQVSGGTGSAAAAAGSVNYMPTISSWAAEEVQVLTSNFAAEYGNAMGGVVNMVAKNGSDRMYEGYMRWKSDIPSLFGSAKNGFKATAGLESTYEFGIGGPLPFLSKSTFFLSSKYFTEKYRSNGLDVKDPSGNSITRFDDNGSEVRNITGRFRFQLDDDIALILGGTWGLTTLASNNWGWAYANTPSMTLALNTSTGGVDTTMLSTVPERISKVTALNNYISSVFLRVNHTLSDASFYELTLSSNNNLSEDARRKIELGSGSLVKNGVLIDPSSVSSKIPTAGFFSGWDLMTPFDKNEVNSAGNFEQGSDLIPDFYQLTTINRPIDGRNIRVNSPNPLTGYVEADEDLVGTNNPYGLNGVFTNRGNERGFEFKSSNMLELNGDYSVRVETGETKHVIKTGVNARYFTIRKHQNNLPWVSNGFFDVYDDIYGGNLYSDSETEREQGSKPRNALTGAFFVQDQISYKGIVFNGGLRFDVLDPQSQYRINATTDDNGFADATLKVQISPRIFVSYPLSDVSFFTIAYGIYQQPPRLQQLYDNTIMKVNRGNSIVGNPNMEPERTNQFNVSYNTMLTDDIAFDVSAYYKDVYKLSGLSYYEDTRYPYAFYSNGEYGNSRGIELSIKKRISQNFDFNVNYALGFAQGTASNATSNYSSAILAGADPFNGKKALPLTEYSLDFDRRHRLNAILNFSWANNEGPSIAGVKFLENSFVNFSGLFQTGTPFTLLDLKGNQAGEFNAERQPSIWSVDFRFQKSFFLNELLGDWLGSTSRVDFYFDIVNLFNRTNAVSLYARTKDPDNDGVSTSRLEGEFPAGWYKDANPLISSSTASSQYDRVGNRLYNSAADSNNDGYVSQSEHYSAYRKYLSDAISRLSNYQFPRQVFGGVMLWF